MIMNDQVLGFIGGSGLYEIGFVDNNKLLDIKSPWGNPSDKIIEGTINGNKIYFLSRHGQGHKLSPSSIKNIVRRLFFCVVTSIE